MTRHDADQVIGRITVRRTLDRRFRIRYDQPEPVRPTWSDVWQALAGFVVLGLCFLATWLWLAVLAAGPNGPGSVVR